MDETSGVISENIWEVHATTLGFLWPPQATVFLMSRCVVWLYAVEIKINERANARVYFQTGCFTISDEHPRVAQKCT